MKRETLNHDKRPSIIDNLFEKPACKRYVKILFFHRILYQQVYHEMRNIPSPNFLAVGLTLGPNG